MAKANANKGDSKKATKGVAAASKPVDATKFKVVGTRDFRPSKLRLNPKFMGRSAPVAEDDVIALADSIRTNRQQQPLQVRLIDGTDEAEVIFGNTRKRAGDLIEAGYESPTSKNPIEGDDEFMLRCEVVECTDEDAFLNNVVENAHRNACSAIDNAKNQQALRDGGMSDNAIARVYGYSGSAFVNRLKKLLNLPEYYQQKIHEGTMTASAGFLFADAKDVAEAEAWDEVWAKAAGESDEESDEASVGSAQMVAALKEWRKEQKAGDGEGEGTEGGGEGDEGDEGDEGEDEKSYILNRSQFYKLIGEIGGDERMPEKGSELCGAILDAMDGKKGAKALVNAILKATGEKLLPKPEKTEEAPAEGEGADAETASEEGEQGAPAKKGRGKK